MEDIWYNILIKLDYNFYAILNRGTKGQDIAKRFLKQRTYPTSCIDLL